jgi:transposase-like protein
MNLDGKHKRNAWAGKVAVLGLLQRHEGKGKSRVRTMPVDNVRRHRFQPIALDNIEDGSTVYTDKLATYDTLSVYYQHKVIDHAEKYVDGVVHTNEAPRQLSASPARLPSCLPLANAPP